MPNVALRAAALVAALAAFTAVVASGRGGDAPASTDDAASRTDVQQQGAESL